MEKSPIGRQTYIEPQDGNDISLTIDAKIQSISEKYLSQAVNNSKSDGGNVIIMNPKTGDILAMATYPDYNLNEPFTPNSSISTKNWNKLSSEEKNNVLYKMWNNTAAQSTYEPGSTFKLITAAAALEENLITPNRAGDFYCSGSEPVSSININCWRVDNPHGRQTLTQALR